VTVKKTGFYDMHLRHHAKMVEFAGFSMPIQYTSILDEHKKVRTSVGVFDVSHMGEIEISGSAALDFVNHLTINDASKIEINQAQYSAMCYKDGGIVDDLIVYRLPDKYLLVVNAANTKKDFDWIAENRFPEAEVRNISDEISQLAVQGKNAEATLQKLTEIDLSAIKFYWFVEGKLADIHMIISRTGYTGEPGFELYFPRNHSEAVWGRIMEAGKEFDIAPIGLAARDSLRLEKKYCLYGNDIDATTNPFEAGLGWITKMEKNDFIGKEALVKIKQDGIRRRIVGFEVDGRMIPRHGYEILKDEESIGQVTSGAFSPILERNIGLGYIDVSFANVSEEIQIGTAAGGRGRLSNAKIVKTPFL
jgi:aminomethyltransferase